MTDLNLGNTDVPELMAALALDPQSLDGDRRLALAKGLKGVLESGRPADEKVVSAMRALAGDASWKVRKAVADALPHISDEDFAALAAGLTEDDNFFVKASAEKALDRRRRTQRDASRKEQALRQCGSRLERFRQRHGDVAAAEALRMAEDRANTLLGSIAHDLRSILTPLKANAAGLPPSAVDADVVRAKAKVILDGMAFLERCVADMESYAAPLPVERHPEDLGRVIVEAHELALKNLIELGCDPAAVTFSLTGADGLRVRIARHLMVLAVANLLKNAYEIFMTGGARLDKGTITVTVAADAGEVRIVICDTGKGMVAEDLTELRALVPVRRNKAKIRSTGFGLPIANRYVAAHGGTLTIDSNRDQGTVVTITLPRGQDEEVQ